MNLPQAFVERTRHLLGEEYTHFEEALQQEVPVSIRPNRQKLVHEVEGQPVPWAASGLYLKHRPTFTFDPLFHAGCYYVQEASSMFVERVLQTYVSNPVVMLDSALHREGNPRFRVVHFPKEVCLWLMK